MNGDEVESGDGLDDAGSSPGDHWMWSGGQARSWGAAGTGSGVGGAGGTAAGVGGIVADEGHVCSTALGDEACVGGGCGRATSQADGAVARGDAIAAVRGVGTTRSSSRRKSSEARVVVLEGESWLVKGNESSSKTMWREMIILFVAMSMQRYPLCEL